jgi:hypothetical protein
MSGCQLSTTRISPRGLAIAFAVATVIRLKVRRNIRRDEGDVEIRKAFLIGRPPKKVN